MIDKKQLFRCNKWDCSKHNEGYGLPCEDGYEISYPQENDWKEYEKKAWETFWFPKNGNYGMDFIANYWLERMEKLLSKMSLSPEEEK